MFLRMLLPTSLLHGHWDWPRDARDCVGPLRLKKGTELTDDSPVGEGRAREGKDPWPCWRPRPRTRLQRYVPENPQLPTRLARERGMKMQQFQGLAFAIAHAGVRCLWEDGAVIAERSPYPRHDGRINSTFPPFFLVE